MTEIEKRRYRNDIITNIRIVETYIKRSEDTIVRLKYNTDSFESSSDFKKQQLEKLKNNINENNVKLEGYNYELSIIDTGKLDDVITALYKKQNKEVLEKNVQADRLKDNNKKELDDRKTISNEYYHNIRNSEYKSRRIEIDSKHGLRRYYKVVDSLPPYIKRNLKEMPNNKGYIWKGCWFFGERKAESNTAILFEKRRGGILVIHEIDNINHKIYEKKDKGRKYFVSETKRRKIPQSKIISTQ
jgi:hypothetical protein